MIEAENNGAVFHPNVKDTIGKKFGRLTVLSRAGTNKGRCAIWNCRCDCGEAHVATGTHLRNGVAECCRACSNKKIAKAKTVHGMSNTTEDNSWRAMIGRCYDKNNWKYPKYGAVGIFVCPGLKSSEAFHRTMGLKPTPKHTIDRIENTGSYVCGRCEECVSIGRANNVRWATATQQAQNKKKNRYIEYNGERLCIAEWARKTGLTYLCLFYRLKNGWSIHDALTKPKQNSNAARADHQELESQDR